jgi:hypothetical protein
MLVHLLHPVIRRPGGGSEDVDPMLGPGEVLVAMGLSFPVFDDSEIRNRVVYKVNVIEWRSLWEQDVGDDFEVDDAFA